MEEFFNKRPEINDPLWGFAPINGKLILLNLYYLFTLEIANYNFDESRKEKVLLVNNTNFSRWLEEFHPEFLIHKIKAEGIYLNDLWNEIFEQPQIDDYWILNKIIEITNNNE